MAVISTWPRRLQAAPWVERWPAVAVTRAGRRGPRKRSTEEPRGDGLLWQGYREQQQLRAHMPALEQQAAEQRASVLVKQGWGALRTWLSAPAGAHPGESAHQLPRPVAGGGLLDLFDDVAA
jgi:hypothetical protein